MTNDKKDIPVIILCGGQGTRMREETEYKPKPMVEIGGKPIIWHIMKIYSYYGFNNFILALGYKGDMIKNYFINYKYFNNNFTLNLGTHETKFYAKDNLSEKDWKVTLVNTGENAQTGARIKRCMDYVDTDDFCVTYGDGVANVDILSEYKFHKGHNKLVTMLGVKPISKFGELVTDGDKVLSFSEKPQNNGVINGGFFIMKKEFFSYLTRAEHCVLEGPPMESVTNDGELRTYRHEGSWHCMDTYRDYIHLNNMWRKKNRPWAVWEQN